MLPLALIAAKAGGPVAHQWGRSQDTSGLLDKSRGAANGSSNTCAFVEGAGLEGVSILIVDTVQVTAHCHHV